MESIRVRGLAGTLSVWNGQCTGTPCSVWDVTLTYEAVTAAFRTSSYLRTVSMASTRAAVLCELDLSATTGECLS